MTDETTEPNISSSPESQKTVKAKPQKVLPTERLNFEKQLNVLRGYAAASGPERKAISNRDVGAIIPLHENTVSTCNPFFQDIGLLSKEGQKSRPSDEVVDYAQAFEWDADKAAFKLASVFRKAWFGVSLIPILAFRSLTREEATTFLANEAKAPKEYKANLEVILDYLKVVGVINYDGATITLGPNARENSDVGARDSEIILNGKGNVGEIPPPPSPLAPPDPMHPFIKGLINKLPEPEAAWSLTDRIKWLTTAANIFDLMYTTDDDLMGINVSLEGTTVSIKKGQP